MGGDPFSLPSPRSPATRSAAPESELSFGGDELARLDLETIEIEQQAKRVEEQVKESARQLQQVQPRRRVQEAVQEHMERARDLRPRTSTNKGRWHMTAARARAALVYAEILGPPKAEQKE
jgi:hypothetical protein